MPTAPTQNGVRLDQFNDAMRASPGWRAFMQRVGQPLDGRPIHLTEGQRKALTSELRRAGFMLPDGVEIDPAGNVNQDNTGFFEKTSVRIGIASAAALATAGALGWGPLAGLLSSGGGQAAGGAAASGTLASSTIPGAHAAVPGAIASQGASAGVGWLQGLNVIGSQSAADIIGASPAGHIPGRAIPGAHRAVPSAIAPQVVRAGAPAFGGGSGLASTLKDIATDPRTYLGAAAMIPQFSNLLGGGRGPSDEESALLDEARQGMALQRQRLEQAQPVYDTLIRMSYGNMPTRHRGDAPAGYQAPFEQYPYAPPRFGGR